jgi:predicted O-methyltransferase YrrM
MLGAFDLVFVDAAPVKYRQAADSIVRMLRPGGMLVIDDLLVGPTTSELEVVEKDALRRSLLHHPELRALELDWSSGVIVATKVRTWGDAAPKSGMAAGAVAAHAPDLGVLKEQ